MLWEIVLACISSLKYLADLLLGFVSSSNDIINPYMCLYKFLWYKSGYDPFHVFPFTLVTQPQGIQELFVGRQHANYAQNFELLRQFWILLHLAVAVWLLSLDIVISSFSTDAALHSKVLSHYSRLNLSWSRGCLCSSQDVQIRYPVCRFLACRFLGPSLEEGLLSAVRVHLFI